MAQLGDYVLANDQFPDRICRHRLEYPDVKIFEQVAEELAEAKFPEVPTTRFIRQVCRWGGYYGIAVRVLTHYRDEEYAISNAFRRAYRLLSDGDEVGALDAINDLWGLGKPSFASKFLRFLSPRSAAILDGIISENTGFSMKLEGYGQLLQSCRKVADELKIAGIANPVRQSGEWYIADVEAAFYADMRSYTV